MLVKTALQRMAGMPVLPFEAAFGAGPILVLAPHPDDESLGCGGLIAEACCNGQPPMVVVLTDGTMSHPNSRQYNPERLRQLREDEAAEATHQLGLPRERLTFMRYKDTQAPSDGPALQQAADALATVIHAAHCETVVTTWQHDPHCDHVAAYAIARLACRISGARLRAYPVWGLTLPPDEMIDQVDVTGFRLDIRQHLPRKRAAIMAHRSQYAGVIGDDPGGFQMQPEFIDRFLTGTELFLDCP